MPSGTRLHRRPKGIGARIAAFDTDLAEERPIARLVLLYRDTAYAAALDRLGKKGKVSVVDTGDFRSLAGSTIAVAPAPCHLPATKARGRKSVGLLLVFSASSAEGPLFSI